MVNFESQKVIKNNVNFSCLFTQITFSTLLIVAVCRMRVREPLWLSDRGLKPGIRRSDVWFLMETDSFFLFDMLEIRWINVFLHNILYIFHFFNFLPQFQNGALNISLFRYNAFNDTGLFNLAFFDFQSNFLFTKKFLKNSLAMNFFFLLVTSQPSLTMSFIQLDCWLAGWACSRNSHQIYDVQLIIGPCC